MSNLRASCFECNRGRGTLVVKSPRNNNQNNNNYQYKLNPDAETSQVHPQDLFEHSNYFAIEHSQDGDEQFVDLKEIIAYESLFVRPIPEFYEWQVKLYFRSNPRIITLHLSPYGYDIFILRLKRAKSQ